MERPEEAKAKGRRARADMVELYSLPVMGRVLQQEVERISRHVQQQQKTKDSDMARSEL